MGGRLAAEGSQQPGRLGGRRTPGPQQGHPRSGAAREHPAPPLTAPAAACAPRRRPRQSRPTAALPAPAPAAPRCGRGRGVEGGGRWSGRAGSAWDRPGLPEWHQALRRTAITPSPPLPACQLASHPAQAHLSCAPARSPPASSSASSGAFAVASAAWQATCRSSTSPRTRPLSLRRHRHWLRGADGGAGGAAGAGRTSAWFRHRGCMHACRLAGRLVAAGLAGLPAPQAAQPLLPCTPARTCRGRASPLSRAGAGCAAGPAAAAPAAARRHPGRAPAARAAAPAGAAAAPPRWGQGRGRGGGRGRLGNSGSVSGRLGPRAIYGGWRVGG